MARRSVAACAPLLAFASFCANAELELGPLFTDHAVLQRDVPAQVWGRADPGAMVRVTLAGERAIARAGSEGRWRVALGARPAGGPHRLLVSSGDDDVTADDLYFGDVWICSGQSNMDWKLHATVEAERWTEAASIDGLRLLYVKRHMDREPQERFESDGWRVSSPESAPSFSAVGWHLGRSLVERAGVPVGLIHTAWGGTPAEAWTPMPEILAKPEAFAQVLRDVEMYDVPEDELRARFAALDAEHAAHIELCLERDRGAAEGWREADLDESAWTDIEAPGAFEPTLGELDGVVWFRKTVRLPGSASGETGELRLGKIRDYDTAYVNGVEIGSTPYGTPRWSSIERVYPIPAGVLRAGENTIAVKILNVRSMGGFVDKSAVLALTYGPGGDGSVSLAGTWKARLGYNGSAERSFPREARYADPAGRSYRRAAVMYNGMIRPLIGFPIAGVAWYQGESNNRRHVEYAELFPTMIEAWREAWAPVNGANRDFLFVFAQLPEYRSPQQDPVEHGDGWPPLREAQAAALELPNTAMAVTLGLGDAGDIHPRWKRPVGERLAEGAMRLWHDDPNADERAPTFTGLTREGSTLRVRFDHAEGLRASDGRDVEGFAIAGPDGVFRWAFATIEDGPEGPSVVLRKGEVQDPVHAAYAWANNPRCNLVNGRGVPARPFRTDRDPQWADE